MAETELTNVETSQLLNTENPTVVQEQTTEIAPVEVVKTIVTILTSLLSDNQTLQNINFTLNTQEITLLNILLTSNPTLFIDAQNVFNKFLSDNNISIADLPELLSIQKKFIDVINNLKNINNQSHVTSNIIKFLVRVMIKENLITVNNNEQFLVDFDNLVNTVSELMTVLNNVRTKSSLSCNINWCSLFSCKK